MAANPEYLHEKMIKFTLNGEAIDAFGDETILETARRHGIEIPTLCYLEGYRPDGNCRACMVEIKAGNPRKTWKCPATMNVPCIRRRW